MSPPPVGRRAAAGHGFASRGAAGEGRGGVTLVEAAVALLLAADGIAIGLLSVFFLPLHAGAVPIPIMAPVAAAANVAMVMLAAKLTDRTLITALPLIGWIAVFLAAGVGGPGGGNVVLPGDWRSLLLLFLGGVPALLWLGNGALSRSFARGARGR